MPRPEVLAEPARRVGEKSLLAGPLSISQLHRQWKPRRDSYARMDLYADVRIRVHRAFTWLERADAFEGAADQDARLISQWIGMTALYGRWDPKEKAPATDRIAIPEFLERLRGHDHHGLLEQVLKEQRTLVASIFADPYLERHFRESAARRKGPQLDRLFARLHFVRSQLIDGGATYNSGLNRSAIRRATLMLEHLAPAILQVIVDHGYADEWGPLCFPPAE